ncbi:sulfatase-like hydrolase/transferase [Luteolibacter marinus]|uniref:sulfatase-like hydrolase/transferase n=1 Tax=Luteolibacter marinus TaxID=2776705 RepID=UPI00186933C7|nr:sulfatase-like hydrolase/transferase [Luteolibacter marinus]
MFRTSAALARRFFARPAAIRTNGNGGKSGSRSRRLLVLGLLGMASAPAATAPGQATGAPPNVLILLADDLGYGDVGFNGGKTIATPQLDRLAASGKVLDDFRACPMCSPTRAGLMTGRWPLRFGMMRAVVPPWSEYGLPASEHTLPELLASAGYGQRGIFGKWHLGHSRLDQLPPARGFTRFIGHYNGAIDYFTHQREGELDWHHDQEPSRQEGYTTDLLGSAAAAFIREAPEGMPWLLYVPFNAPHSPFQAKPEDLKKYGNLTGIRRTYAAMVDSMDQAIGKILAAVEARPDAANTLVLFFSDNGGVSKAGSSNGPYRGEKLTVYEGGTRVCAAIRWPAGGIDGGGHFGGRIGYIDVLPTVLAAAGATPPADLDGIDFLPALRGKASLPERPWFSYMHQSDRAHASVHSGEWKLVAHGNFFAENPRRKPAMELYHLADDADETTDVAASHPKIVARLAKRLREFGTWQKPGVGSYDEGRAGFKAPKDWRIEK